MRKDLVWASGSSTQEMQGYKVAHLVVVRYKERRHWTFSGAGWIGILVCNEEKCSKRNLYCGSLLL